MDKWNPQEPRTRCRCTLNPKVGNSIISNYSSKLEQAVEKLVWQQKIGIVKVRSTGESKHTTSKGCQNTKKFLFFILMEKVSLHRKNVFNNNVYSNMDEEIFEAALKQIYFIFWITWQIVPSCMPEKLEQVSNCVNHS